MQVDFSNADHYRSFVTVPEGTYVCAIREVRESESREGAPRWWFRLEVVEGDYAGRTAAWDGISFHQRGLGRAKAVLGRLGFDTRGVLDVNAEDLIGRTARVDLVIEEREDQETGTRVERLRVPYLGYQALEDASDGESTPF